MCLEDDSQKMGQNMYKNSITTNKIFEILYCIHCWPFVSKRYSCSSIASTSILLDVPYCFYFCIRRWWNLQNTDDKTYKKSHFFYYSTYKGSVTMCEDDCHCHVSCITPYIPPTLQNHTNATQNLYQHAVHYRPTAGPDKSWFQVPVMPRIFVTISQNTYF
jgi:hypothetical protein